MNHSRRQPLVSDDDAPTGAAGPPARGLAIERRVIWFVVTAVALLLMAFLKVPAYDYDRFGLDISSQTIASLWWRQIQGLPDVAYDGLLAVLFAGLIVISLAGSGALLWYCLYPGEAVRRDRSLAEPSSES